MATWQGTKAINPSQLSLELGGASLLVTGDWPEGRQKTVTTQGVTQSALDAAILAHVADFSPESPDVLLAAERAWAKQLASDEGGPYKLERAVLLVLLDEVNVLRQWITSFKAAVAAAATLADLKTRVSALPAMPDRTSAQARAAVAAKIDSGAADS